ncbi:MAG: asparagine synthase (glutamine-hydrolyzing) [bacterium]|nr:asparagine synthase (glutamine-hydrolyzing) [bacterium]
MCGICGKLTFAQKKVDSSLISAMVKKLSHRGPDDTGVYINKEKNIGLGHARLSIIDLSQNAHQPMSNEDETIWIVFNGEIYNFIELREELVKNGHRFVSQTDSEVIIHLYEDMGIDCLAKLRGMFAFAIWDEINQRLFLARDRAGKKPLVYAKPNNSFVFASESKALLKDADVGAEPNLDAINDYLTYGYIPSPATSFKGIYKLPPAHWMTVDSRENIHVERYWKLNFYPKFSMSEEEYSQEIINQLKEATRLRMISDVPLGAFLSGGIDSSAVVAMMSELSSQPVKTFSIGFKEKRYDETRYAKMVAERFGTEHTEIVVSPDLSILPQIVYNYNEPFFDSSAIPSFYVSAATRNHVTVALNGDGGDECFAGYQRYKAFFLAEYLKIPHFLRTKLCRVGDLFPDGEYKSLNRKIKKMLEVIGKEGWQRYLYMMKIFSSQEKEGLYTQKMKDSLKQGIYASESLMKELFDSGSSLNGIDRLLYIDIHSYLSEDLLVKMDIASMSVSLETRSPFLDHRLMEFAAKIPSHLKLRRFTTKMILKKALRQYLPDEILYRQKMGFDVPLDCWFRHELKETVRENLLGNRIAQRNLLNPAVVRQIVEQHLQGKRNHAQKIYSLLMLEFWYRIFIDGEKICEKLD